MKRILVTALLLLIATPLVVAAGATTAGAEGNAGCAVPVPVRSYTHDQLTYRLAVDLTDCDWWDNTPVQLDASLERIDPAGGHGAGSFTLCGAGPVDADGEDGADDTTSGIEAPASADATSSEATAEEDDSPALRPGACAVEVSLDHPSLDAAHYEGAISFPWQGGRRTVSFNAICEATTGCVDLPVDPTTVLNPAADLYEAIGGGDDNAG
jgi:hypothetical protein